MRRVLKWLFGLLALLLIAGFAIGYTPDTDAAAMKAKYGSPASQFVDVGDGITVHLRDEGKRDGPVLVLVHGSNASLHTWEPWVKRLGDSYRIVTLDLPGHGLTGTDPRGVYDYPAFIDVVNRVMTKLNVARAVIGGNSMGGGVAWMFALAHPEKTAGVLLIDAAGAPQWTARKAPIGFRIARTPVLKEVAKVITPRSMFESSLKTSVYDANQVTPELVDRYWELNRYPGNRDASLKRFALPHNNRQASKAKLAAIKAPVMIVWGAEDNLIPVSSARWFKEALPAATLVIYDRIGHIPMEERPDQSAQDVRKWLETIGDPAGK
jgi:pimeloyl-ACP methyl ester carboxylesterase